MNKPFSEVGIKFYSLDPKGVYWEICDNNNGDKNGVVSRGEHHDVEAGCYEGYGKLLQYVERNRKYGI